MPQPIYPLLHFSLICLSRQKKKRQHNTWLDIVTFLHSTNSGLKRSRIIQKKGELGWEGWTISNPIPSDISVWSCMLNQRKPIPETETPYADTAIKKCFPCDNWMLQRSECSTFWMEIKASCNATSTWSECAKNPLLGLPSVDGIQGEKGFPSGYISQHSSQWPPGSKVKQTFCQLKPDQLVWQHMEKGRWALVMDH